MKDKIVNISVIICLMFVVCNNAMAIQVEKPKKSNTSNADSRSYIDRSDYYKAVIGSNEFKKLSKSNSKDMANTIGKINKYSPLLIIMLNKHRKSDCITHAKREIMISTSEEMLACNLYSEMVEYAKAFTGGPVGVGPIENFDSFFKGVDKWYKESYGKNNNKDKALELQDVHVKSIIIWLTKYIDEHEAELSSALASRARPAAPLPSNNKE
jgi:hypothetical protein